MTRKDFLLSLAGAALLAASPREAGAADDAKLTLDTLRSAAKSMGLAFSDDELQGAMREAQESFGAFAGLRELADDPFLPPATVFRVMGRPAEVGVDVETRPAAGRRPPSDDDLAFLPVTELASLLRSRQITSTELTKLYLARLKRYGPKLKCVVNLTEDLALKQAADADRRLAEGNDHGPLLGVPYGLKDLFAVPGYPTTWGAEPYQDQMFEKPCAVFEKLSEAGAVLVAKLSLGALAQGDVWYGGRTESPWDPKIGSSGSSAGSAAATAAGLVGFAIGTETSGSIVSPSHNCRVTGLRPTFGSISRFGAMALSWSMDKVGPICRTAEDCAHVFAALLGADARDPSSIDRGFHYQSQVDHAAIRYGVWVDKEEKLKEPVKTDGDPALELLGKLGARFSPFWLPEVMDAMTILAAEASAAFEKLTRSGRVNEIKNSSWPATFRAYRFTPAVEFIEADRCRRRLQEEYEERFKAIDVLLIPNQGYDRIGQLNLTGHPQVLVPMGVDEKGEARSVSLVGPLFSESRLLAVAADIQARTRIPDHRPELVRWE